MRIGIYSTSRIVTEFLPHLCAMEEVEIVALCCRPESEEKGRRLCEQYKIPSFYTNFEEFISEGEFDFLYNASANHMHFGPSLAALEAGKNVILEKPFTGTSQECETLFSKAEEKGLFLFEAITIPYMPGFVFLQENLSRIGAVHNVISNYSRVSSRYNKYLNHEWSTSFDPEMAGGALNDMNVYNLALIVSLFGLPKKAVYAPVIGYNGVDTDGTALLRYKDMTAVAQSCKGADGISGSIIHGEAGTLVVKGEVGCLPEVWLETRNGKILGPETTEHRCVYEFREFDRVWKEQDLTSYAVMTERTKNVMRLMDILHNNTF